MDSSALVGTAVVSMPFELLQADGAEGLHFLRRSNRKELKRCLSLPLTSASRFCRPITAAKRSLGNRPEGSTGAERLSEHVEEPAPAACFALYRLCSSGGWMYGRAAHLAAFRG